MALYLGFVNREHYKRPNGRNTVLVSAATEDAARTRAEQLIGAAVGELGTSANPSGWAFVVLNGQEGFAEGNFIAASGTDLATFAQRGA